MTTEQGPKTAEKKSVFRESALEQLTSPEQLKEYIHVTPVSVWLILAAILLALASLLAWGIGGRVTVTEDAVGVASGNTVMCYLADASGISEGMKVRLGDSAGVVDAVSAKPLSEDELLAKYESYIVGRIVSDGFVYEVTVTAETPQNGVVSASIITEELMPISLLLK